MEYVTLTQRKHWLPILMTILISGLTFGYVGFWFGQNQSKQEVSTSQVDSTTVETDNASATSEQSATSTSDAHSDWKNYTNNKWYYSIKYPTDWSIDTARTTEDRLVFDTGIQGESNESLELKQSGEPLENWVSSFDEQIVLKRSDMTVADHEAVRVDTSEFGQTYIGFKRSDALFIFITGGRMLDNGMLTTFELN